MTVLTPPATLPVNKDKIRRIAPSRVMRSAWSGSRQVEILPGARWGFKIGLTPQVFATASAKAWRAFFTSLNGPAGIFKIYPEFANQTPSSGALVRGAAQTGYTLSIDGYSGSLGLVAGDWITVPYPNKGNGLHMITALTDQTTYHDLTIWPALREAPSDNASVEIQMPWAEVSLLDDEFEWERDLMLFHYFELDVEESW